MSESEVKEYLAKPCNYDVVNELYIYLRNDRRIVNSMNRELGEFAKKKIKEKKFNKVLFVQAVKLSVDKWLKDPYFKREYGVYLPNSISIIDKYHTAYMIARYILFDFFRISL